jgi:iron complex outermembrane receptor protein
MGKSHTSTRAMLLAATALAGSLALGLSTPAAAQEKSYRLDLPSQPLVTSLVAFGATTDQQIVFQERLIGARAAPALKGDYTPTQALAMLLDGSGLTAQRTSDGIVMIRAAADPQSGSAAGGGAEVEGLIVTAQKREENIQDVPIAMSAFSQETLTERQVAGGPDLITQIPNMSFTKTNFSSYSIQIRGIGTQAISATTDPAVAVAFNNTPFIRNRFFEQEFYDLERLEVLRGPQGTLYGRNATAGVVNLISAKPKFTYAAKLSGDLGNYNSRRIEGMVNIPLVEDVVALRLAAAWTKREGYASNQLTGRSIDGRDLWSTRLSLRFEPTDRISANLIWEHFQEDDDRLRSGKQLCKKAVSPTSLNGIPVDQGGAARSQAAYLSQGCVRTSLYSPDAFQTPNGYSLPFYGALIDIGGQVYPEVDPYLNSTQSRDLRVIESSVEPEYRAKADIVELQASFDLTDTLTLNSETSYGADSSWSLQDYNRFTTTPGAFAPSTNDPDDAFSTPGLVDANGVFCDPQLGCSDRLLLVDLSTEESTQFSQEFRLGSDFDGPFNFSLGANYMRHDAEAKYYVFINSLTMLGARGAPAPYSVGQDNASCVGGVGKSAWSPGLVGDTAPRHDPLASYVLTLNNCFYTDPNSIENLNDEGRNYFLSRNPYKLVSYAAFGEVYYNITPNLKLTGGMRLTVDRKTAPQIPSWLSAQHVAGEYPVAKTLFQEWREPTGRLAVDWKPDLGFTDETLLYASYAHGYKAGGANPPPPVLVVYNMLDSGASVQEFLPDTFEPEFIDAFEVGTKNTLLDGALTLNLTGFYYDYRGYQVSEIRNRSAVNSNYDAEVWGVEAEADWRPTEALRLGFKGGYNGTRIADGEKAIDLMDRTAGQEGWIVIRPFPTMPSNCVIPIHVITAGGAIEAGSRGVEYSACVQAYVAGLDPATHLPYVPNPTVWDEFVHGDPPTPLPARFAGYPGWDPSTAPNGGRGFDKQLGGNELPNAPNYTATLTADYTLALPNDWLMNLHGDLHWQSESWWRVFNDHEYDRLDAFYTANLAAIFTNEDAGWKVMAYIKNVFDETAITGAFLNSDDTGLTTNVFLTEPRLYGVRVTKDFTGGGWLGEIGRCNNVCPVTVEIGGGVARYGAETTDYTPAWLNRYNSEFPLSQDFQDEGLDWGDTRSVEITYAPNADWRISAAYRFGKTNGMAKTAAYQDVAGGLSAGIKYPTVPGYYIAAEQPNHFRAAARDSEEFEIAEFLVGREVGLGAFGDGGRSRLSVGIRHAVLDSTSKVSMDGVPTQLIPPVVFPFDSTRPQRTREVYTTVLTSDRSFEGWGPLATWDAAIRLWGNEDTGRADLEWSAGAGALRGEQTSQSVETRYGAFEITSLAPGVQTTSLYNDPIARERSGDVTVPTLSLSLGLSYAIDRVKVSTGYSYDRFFDVIDGGYEETQSFDRTIHGPYLKLSLGFGG